MKSSKKKKEFKIYDNNMHKTEAAKKKQTLLDSIRAVSCFFFFFLQNSLVLRLQATKRRVFHSFPPAIRELAVLPQ